MSHNNVVREHNGARALSCEAWRWSGARAARLFPGAPAPPVWGRRQRAATPLGAAVGRGRAPTDLPHDTRSPRFAATVVACGGDRTYGARMAPGQSDGGVVKHTGEEAVKRTRSVSLPLQRNRRGPMMGRSDRRAAICKSPYPWTRGPGETTMVRSRLANQEELSDETSSHLVRHHPRVVQPVPSYPCDQPRTDTIRPAHVCDGCCRSACSWSAVYALSDGAGATRAVMRTARTTRESRPMATRFMTVSTPRRWRMGERAPTIHRRGAPGNGGGATPRYVTPARVGGAGSKVCFRDTETPAGAALGGTPCYPPTPRSHSTRRHTGPPRAAGKGGRTWMRTDTATRDGGDPAARRRRWETGATTGSPCG